MIPALETRAIETVVLDIEGTTTPIAFVYDVLFPYVRQTLRAYVEERIGAPDLREALRLLREDWAREAASGDTLPVWRDFDYEALVESVIAYAEWQMDRDRKAPGLKALQGHISARGYESGELRGEVFPDVPRAFERWRAAGLTIAIFSSGSVLAQQMLFRTTTSGDLTRWIDAYFDTGVGPKGSPDSYRRIAAALGRAESRVLFVSDAPVEVDAARAAGLVALRCVRPRDGTAGAAAGGTQGTATPTARVAGVAADDDPHDDPIYDFDEIILARA